MERRNFDRCLLILRCGDIDTLLPSMIELINITTSLPLHSFLVKKWNYIYCSHRGEKYLSPFCMVNHGGYELVHREEEMSR